MDAAVLVQLEAIDRSPFEQYGPGRYRDTPLTPGQHDIPSIRGPLLQSSRQTDLKSRFSRRSFQATGNNTRSLTNQAPSSPAAPEPGSGSEPEPLAPASPLDSSPSPPSISAPQVADSPPATPDPTGSVSTFASLVSASDRGPFSFPASCYARIQEQLRYKRLRPLSDVDGPHTAGLSCKKRRLGKQLITSMLSQPFSLPATHILNREGASSGDKRFLKLAAISASRRLSGVSVTHGHHHHPGHPTFLRRAAVINKFRLRVRNEAVEKGHIKVADIATNAALLQLGHGVGSTVSARFPATSPHQLPAGPIPPLPRPSNLGPHGSVSKQTADERQSSPGPPQTNFPAADQPRLKPPPSPRLNPQRSPELKSTKLDFSLEGDELDDGEASFPCSEHDSRYDSSDDPEDVYADFEVIFCGSSSNADSSDDEGENYEDAMDDLDGIPWTAR